MKMKPQKQLLQFVMLALLSVVSVLVTSNESFAAMTCASCHGNGVTGTDARPLDTPAGSPVSYRNISTGDVKGNHRTHMSQTMDPNMCSRCHNNTAYTTGHRSGTISLKSTGMNFSTLGSYTTATTRQRSISPPFVFKNQTSVPVLGTCSTVNCHFERTSPVWGTDPTAVTCGTCHDAVPGSLAHPKHTAQYGGAASCVKCHSARPNFQHATSAGNAGRGIDVKNTNYTPGSNNQYLPSQSVGRSTGTCSTVYCHSAGQSLDGITSTPWRYTGVVWNGGSTSCSSCHDQVPNTGDHTKHVLKIAAGNCGVCHDGASGSTMASTTHVDGNIDVNGSLAVGYSQGLSSARGNGYGRCSNASCHTPFTTAPLLTPTWGAAPTCASCHDASPVSGAHTLHLQSVSGVTCETCHTGAGTGVVYSSANHLDGTINVSQGYPANVAKHLPGVYNNACSTACHSTNSSPIATPSWGQHTTCTSCHGNSVLTLTTGDHSKHLGATALLPAGLCSGCHTGASAATSGGANHGNTLIDVGGTLTAGYTTPKAKGSATSTCTTTCHSAYTGSVLTPTWGVTAATCGSCHLASPQTGDHTKHVAAVTLGGNNCGSCHTGATPTTYVGATHFDGQVNVAGTLSGANLTMAKKSITGPYTTTCTTACHSAYTGTQVTPTWGSAATCGSCHLASPQTGDHTKHIAAVTLGGNNCGSCHTGATPTTYVGATHFDNQVNVAGTLSGVNLTMAKKSITGPYTTTCTTACHSAYTGTQVTPTWGSAATCGSCHLASPQTGDHTKHIAAVALGGNNCGSCHTGATPTTYVGATHFDNQVNVAGTLSGVNLTMAKKSITGPYTTTCSTSCHSAYDVAKTTPTWGTAATCASCHDASPVTGSHSKHVLHTNPVKPVTCGSCHTGATATTYVSANHYDGNIDVAVGPTNIAKHASGSGYSSCTAACHNGPASNPFTAPAVTWGTVLNCDGCHGYPGSSTNAAISSKHANVAAGSCSSCHNNVKANGTMTNSTFVNVQEHLDGIVQGGNCDSCHGYPPVKSLTNANGPVGFKANYSSARMQNYSGGGGVHDVAGHLLPTLRDSQKLGFNACLNCHPDTSASGQHNQANASFGNFSTKFVQVVVDTHFKFDKNRPIVYNGNRVSGTKTTGTCSNVSCHFQKSPVWSSTPYGQGH